MSRLLPALAMASFLGMGCTAANAELPSPVPAPAPFSRRAAVKRVLQSSVRVHVSVKGELRRAASGVVIDVAEADGKSVSYVVTNEHVVNPHGLESPSYSIIVDGPGKSMEYPAQLAAEGAVPEMDLAVLQIPGVKLSPATLAGDDELAVGDDVVVVGAPFGHGLSVSGGMLSQLEYQGDAPSMLKTDAPVGYGASGGGMFSTETGHLLGVIEGYRTAQVQIPSENTKGSMYSFDVPMPGETFAAPMSKLRRFMAEHKVPGPATSAVATSR